MGPRWILFRILYLLKQKLGAFDRKNNAILEKAESFVPQDSLSSVFPKLTNPNANIPGSTDEDISLIKSGHIKGFSYHGLDYSTSKSDTSINWFKNPISGSTRPSEQPWHMVSDFIPGDDIKLIWEASRFPQLFTLFSAYSHTKNSELAQLAFDQIEDWIDSNPFPNGPNYKCGQEVAMRAFAWILAIDVFRDHLSIPFWNRVTKQLYTDLLRIDANITFATKSVRNNHSISESAGLFAIGTLFPWFKGASQYKKKGLSILKKELGYQVYKDGSYIQHSTNYHRLVLDTLSWVMVVAKRTNITLPIPILESHKKSLLFLGSLVQKNGLVPNYGANDGARLFPFNSSDYRDFRPSLNLATSLQGMSNFSIDGKELCQWFDNQQKTNSGNFFKPKTHFPNGGYFTIKNNRFFVVTRCHSFRHRPSQNDMLHADIWLDGLPLFVDSGTYSYAASASEKASYTGCSAHNTLRIDEKDPMPPVSHFGYGNWITSRLITHTETKFEGEHYGYKNKGITHKRRIELDRGRLKIIDSVKGISSPTKVDLFWNTLHTPRLFSDTRCHMGPVELLCSLPLSIQESFVSYYYLEKQPSFKVVGSLDIDKDCEIYTEIGIL